jgi:hypothetical protein
MPEPSRRDDEFRAHREQYDLAEECLVTLRGFMRAAESPLYYQQLVPDAMKWQLLVGLTRAVPVMEMLSAGSSRSLMDLMGKLKGAPVKGLGAVLDLANLSINQGEIRYADLFPYVTGVIDPLNLALERFRKRHLKARKPGKPVLTVRVAEPTELPTSPTYDVGEGAGPPHS